MLTKKKELFISKNVGKYNIKVVKTIKNKYNYYSKGEHNMVDLAGRIKNARKNLHLSQEYVANYLNVNRTSIVEIESGKRKVSADELRKLSELFRIPADELLNGKSMDVPVDYFARSFSELSAEDQKEIMNLIEFKRMMKERK